MNYQYWQEISFYLDELDKERALFESSPKNAENMDTARKAMSHHLEHLRISLEKRLDVHYTSLIIFAIIAALDERMQSLDFNSPKARWSPLQKDFYAAYTAGEVFFKSVDEILEDPKTPNIVYQVFYYMLKRGFQGKYQDSKTQIAKYIDILKDKIPVATPQVRSEEPIRDRAHKKSLLKAWHYYALSGTLVVALYFSLMLLSNLS